MSYDVAVNIALPAHYAGTQLEAVILDTAGTQLASTTQYGVPGFLELGAGFWVWRYTLAAGFTGEVLFRDQNTHTTLTSAIVADETAGTSPDLLQALTQLIQASETRLLNTINARCSGTGHLATPLKTMPAVLPGQLTTHAPVYIRSLHSMPSARRRQIRVPGSALRQRLQPVPIPLASRVIRPRPKLN